MLFRLVAALLFFLLAAAAQDPAQVPSMRVTVTLVQVDAVVTDSAGRQVKDLEAQDFEILQDGVPKKVTRCTYIAMEPTASPSLPTGPLPQAKVNRSQIRRSIAVVVDDLGLAFESVPEVRRALHKFIDEQLQPGDMAAILRTGGNIGALQQFTTDRRKLHAAVESIRSHFISRIGFSGVNGERLQPAAGAGAGGTEIDTINRLAYVIGSLQSMPGHKSVLLFAETDIIPLRRVGAASESSTQPALLEAVDNLLDQATRSSVAIYGIDSSAHLGQNPIEIAAEAMAGTGGRIQSLMYLSNVTGGKYVGGLTSDLSVPLAQAMADQQGYYLLGYAPDPKDFEGPGKERKFHKISVKVKRPGCTVRSNSGFLGSPDRPAPKLLAHGMIAALNSPFGSPDIEVGMTSVFFDELRGPALTTLVNVKAGDLTMSEGPDGRVAEGEIAVAVFGDNGDVVHKDALGFTARLRGVDYDRAMANGFLFTFHIPMKQPGPYDVRVAVRDKTSGKIGTASSFLELPRLKKDQVAVSGILLQTPAPSGANNGADLRGATALRVFRPGETLSYGYQILNPKLDKATRGPKLESVVSVYRLGKQVFRSKPAPVQVESDPQRVLAGGSLNLGADMTAGDYVLAVEVTDLVANAKSRTATQYIDFYVRQ